MNNMDGHETGSESLEHTIKCLHSALEEDVYLVAEVLVEIKNPLIRRQAVAESNDQGDTSLHYAARIPSENAIKKDLIMKLLDEGDDVNAENNVCQTPFSIAMSMEDYQTVRLLLDRGALPYLSPSDIESDPFCKVVLSGSTELPLFEEYVNRGAPLNIICKSTGNNLLHELLLKLSHLAASSKNLNHHSEIVRGLLTHGLDINLTNKEGETPLYIAVATAVNSSDASSTTTINHLVVTKLDVNNEINKAAFKLAFRTYVSSMTNCSKESWRKVIVKMLKAGFKPDHKDTDLEVFRMSCFKDYFNFVKKLTKPEEDANVVDLDCDTDDSEDEAQDVPSSPTSLSNSNLSLLDFQYSDFYDNYQPEFRSLKYILKYGPDVNIQNENGDTLLHIQSSSEKVKLLLEFDDVDVDIKNNKGETPLQVALDAEKICFSNVRPLIQYGSDINLLKEIVISSYPHSSMNKPLGILIEHISKMKLANLHLGHHESQGDLALQYATSQERENLKIEIDRMMKTYIGNSQVSYYTFLKVPTHHAILKILRNETIMDTLESEKYRDSFPEYGYMISGVFKRGKQRLLLYQLITGIRHIVWPQLTDDCFEDLLCYLTNIDLRNLVHAFVPHEVLAEAYTSGIKESTKKILLKNWKMKKTMRARSRRCYYYMEDLY